MLPLKLFCFYSFLTILVKSSRIEEEFSLRELKRKLWPKNGTLIWTLHHNHSLSDLTEFRQEIQRAFDDWAHDSKLTFREATENEKADLNLAFMSNDHSDLVDDDNSYSNSEHEDESSLDLRHSNDILSKQGQDDIQTLHVTEENPVTTAHRNRAVRSVKEKGKKSKKNKKKSKKNKKKSNKKTKKPRNGKKTPEKEIKSINQPQLFIFNESEKVRIKEAIAKLEPDGALRGFKNLSETIQSATGMLSQNLVRNLQNLTTQYSKITRIVKIGFADLCADLSKFVIKSWRFIQGGMSNENEKFLITLGNQVNTTFQNELAKFVTESISDLTIIFSQLLVESAGKKTEDLMKQKEVLEADFLRRSDELKNVSSKYNKIKSKIDSIKYEKQMYDKSIKDSKAAKSELKQEIERLKAQIPEYEKKIQDHLDTHKIKKDKIFIFTHRVQEVHVTNGEKIARDNLQRLKDRISDLEEKLKNWSVDALEKQIKTTTSSLPKYEQRKTQLEKKQQATQEQYNQAEQKFDDVVRQLNRIYQSSGTVSLKSIKTVDEICDALKTGLQSLTSACEKMRNHMANIHSNKNLLVDAVLDALHLISMADDYNDSTIIKDIKEVLSLK